MERTETIGLSGRIDRLYLFSIQNRAKVGRFGSKVATFNAELEAEFSRETVLWRVREWHRLIGSTPPDDLQSLDESVRTRVLDQINAFLSAIEVDWEVV